MDFECKMFANREDLKKWTYRNGKEYGNTIGIAVYPGIYLRRHDLVIKNLPDGNINRIPYLKLNYCLNGRCEVSLPEERYTYLDRNMAAISVDLGGTSFFYPAGKYNGIEIDFDLKVMETTEPAVFEEMGISPKAMCDSLDKKGSCLTGIVSDEWKEKADSVYALLSEPDHCRIEELRFFLVDLWYGIIHKDLIISDQQKYLSKGQRKLAKDIEAILTADLSRNITISELSKLFGISPASLEKYFSGLYGCSINEYLRKTRINMAMELLSESSMRVLDIAWKIGYKSQSKFGTVFKKHTGLSPLEYRRQQKEVKTNGI